VRGPIVKKLNAFALVGFNPKSKVIRQRKSFHTFKEETQEFYEKAFHYYVISKMLVVQNYL